MSFVAPRPVVSGRAYRVLALADGPPAGLDDFVGDTGFVLELDGEEYRVVGTGRLLDPVVRFHQKDCEGGKDVRVWTIGPDGEGDGFIAVT